MILLVKNRDLNKYYKENSIERAEFFDSQRIIDQWIEIIDLSLK